MINISAMMNVNEALNVLTKYREDAIVITTMSSIGVWNQLSQSELDFAYIPSSMGQAPALGLGLALAQPHRKVIVINGDGCMLMNLGSLVTMANYPANLYLIIMDNGIYEVTGGQLTVGSGDIDFATIAKGAGINKVYSFSSIEDWQKDAADVFSDEGPAVIHLKIEPKFDQRTPEPPMPMQEQIDRLQKALDM